jgi:hypothetical protein
VTTWVGWALAGLAVACASPGSQRIVGPDGSAMAHVHCGSDQGSCYRIAGELCPSGYDMQPVLSGSDGNFLVHCHDARVAPVVAAAPAAVAATSTVAAAPTPPVPSSRSGERWPPASEPWPAAYPWPPPETSAAVQQPTTPAPGTKTEINLGF